MEEEGEGAMPVSLCPICTRHWVSRSFLNHALHVPRSLLNDGTEWDRREKKQRRGRKS